MVRSLYRKKGEVRTLEVRAQRSGTRCVRDENVQSEASRQQRSRHRRHHLLFAGYRLPLGPTEADALERFVDLFERFLTEV